MVGQACREFQAKTLPQRAAAEPSRGVGWPDRASGSEDTRYSTLSLLRIWHKVAAGHSWTVGN